MQHTPGPWRVVISTGGLDNLSVCAERMKVALVTLPADAHLIAAAPDMLEALGRLLDYAEDVAAERDERPSALDLARLALAKAKGKV